MKKNLCRIINKYIAEDENPFGEQEITPAILTVITITAVLIIMSTLV